MIYMRKKNNNELFLILNPVHPVNPVRILPHCGLITDLCGDFAPVIFQNIFYERAARAASASCVAGARHFFDRAQDARLNLALNRTLGDAEAGAD